MNSNFIENFLILPKQIPPIFVNILLLAAVVEQVFFPENSKLVYNLLIYVFFADTSIFLLKAYRDSAVSWLLFILFLFLGLGVVFLSTPYALPKNQHIYFVFAASLSVLFIGLSEKRVRDQGNSLAFIVPAIGLCLFSFLLNMDVRDFSRMTGESVGEVAYADLWSFFAVAGFFCISLWCWTKRQGASRFAAVFLTLIALFVCLSVVVYRIDFSAFQLDSMPQHQYRLATCFLVLLFCFFKSNFLESPKSALIRFADYAATAVFILFPLGSAVYWYFHIQKAEPCIVPRPDYRVSKEMALRVLAAEDRTFPVHHGVNYSNIQKAVRRYVLKGDGRFGGSSITMQLAKVCYLSYDKTLFRKWNQLILGYTFDLLYSKDQIFVSYLEKIPFDEQSNSLTAAARRHFNTTPSKLNSKQSLLLVLSILDPARFNPGVKPIPEEFKRRGRVIEIQLREFKPVLEKNLEALSSVSDVTSDS